MIVTAIEQQKNDKNRYSIFIDYEFAFGLCSADVVYFKLKENEAITQEKFDFINDNLVYIKAQDAAMNFLSFKPRTQKEVELKLIEKEFSENIIGRVLEFLAKYNYVNDEKYCQMYIADSTRLKKKGKFLIKMELIQKGIDESVICEALEESDVDEFENALALAIKKRRSTEDELTEKEKQRLYGVLSRKGYSYSIIKDVFYELENNLDR